MRTAFAVLAGVLLLLALVILTLPWWMGAALRPLARAQGVTFERYERQGYSRFVLHDVVVARPQFRAEIRSLAADAPWRWWWRRAEASARIDGWTVALLPSKTEDPVSAPQRGVADVFALVRDNVSRARHWLPHAVASDGRVVRGEQALAIARLEWADGILNGEGTLPSADPFTLTFRPEADALVVAADLPTFAAGTQLRWQGAEISGTARWWNQPLELQASFPARGWVPQAATVAARAWNVPAERVRLAPAYTHLRGDLQVEWRDNSFTADVSARAEPARNSNKPPLQLTARARGDRERLQIDAFDLRAPFATAVLDTPVRLDWQASALAEPAQLTLRGDLAEQPWVSARGAVEGVIHLATAGSGTFELRIADLSLREFSAPRVELNGSWNWPEIELAALRVSLGDGGELSGRARLDWAQRRVDGVELQGHARAAALARWLPETVTWETARFTLSAEGPLEAPRHRGELRVQGLQLPELKTFDAALEWSGQDRAIDAFTLRAERGDATLRLAGLIDERRAELHELTLQRAGRERWRLMRPAEIVWSPDRILRDLRLAGPAGEIAAAARWSATAEFQVEARDVHPEDWTDWLQRDLPPGRIDTLTAQGVTQGGRLVFTAQGSGRAHWQGEETTIEVAVEGDGRGIRVQRVALGTAERALTTASGTVPLAIIAGTRLRVQVIEDAPLDLTAAVQPDSPLWSALERLTGVRVAEGEVQLRVQGTPRNPRGELTAAATRVESTREESALPPVTGLRLRARAAESALVLEALDLQVAGQAVRARGQRPMNRAAWQALFQNPRHLDWNEAEARIETDDIALADLAKHVPRWPLTQGRAALQLTLRGGSLDGRVTVREAATRPLPGLGVVQEFNADLALRDRTATIERAEALLGGEPLRLGGTVEWKRDGTLGLDLRLRGENVPLVRRPGALVRAALDLRARTEGDGLARITGVVALRESLILADLADILPGGPRGATRVPPYFAIEAEPFARWPIDVGVRGDRALRVRTAVFNGVATPRFQITGTLGDPRAIGQVSIDEGRVLFPFATFAVQQGAARITAADPHALQLNVNATTRRHGYELRMEAGGTLDSPTVTLSSNPPLDAADVLLMVTTGQPPPDDTGALSTQQRLTRLGTFIGRGLFQNLGGDGENRLEITSGEDVSRAGRETYGIEYRLNRRWSITGEYDRYDEYNAGLKWRIYTQGGRRDEREPDPE